MGRRRRTRPDEQFAHVEWNSYPGGKQNPNFVEELKAVCRPMRRCCSCAQRRASKHAARLATEAGYAYAMDVLEGFEGARDEAYHRKTVEGWCKRNLPWHRGVARATLRPLSLLDDLVPHCTDALEQHRIGRQDLFCRPFFEVDRRRAKRSPRPGVAHGW